MITLHKSKIRELHNLAKDKNESIYKEIEKYVCELSGIVYKEDIENDYNYHELIWNLENPNPDEQVRCIDKLRFTITALVHLKTELMEEIMTQTQPYKSLWNKDTIKFI